MSVEKNILVSVIIPTHNRADALSQTLSHLSQQEFEGGWEAIVINNNCSDNTDEVVANQKFPVSLKLLHEKNPGPAAARNCGVSEAAGKFIIFIDNDVVVPKDFVKNHYEVLNANVGCWIVGRVINPKELRETPFGRYRDDIHESYYESYPKAEFTEIGNATGQNWAMSREEFLKVGGFDQGFSIASCEDTELALRARQKGIRNLYNPRNVVLHNDWAIDLESFCRRQELYCISSVLLWRKYGENSFQIDIVKENAPIDWSKDSTKLIVKKSAKAVMSSAVGHSLTRFACKTIEYFAPDTKICYKAYKTAVATATFRGVREGFRRYVGNSDTRGKSEIVSQEHESSIV